MQSDLTAKQNLIGFMHNTLNVSWRYDIGDAMIKVGIIGKTNAGKALLMMIPSADYLKMTSLKISSTDMRHIPWN